MEQHPKVADTAMKLDLILANYNHNNNIARDTHAAAVGTTVVHDHIVEAELPNAAPITEVVGQAAPLLLTLLMGNNNNNDAARLRAGPADMMSTSYDNNNKSVAIPGTVGVFEQITEVDPSKLLHLNQTEQNAAIPGTVGIHDYSAEVDQSKLTHQDQTDKNAAIPGTVGIHDFSAELDPSKLIHQDQTDQSAAIPGTVGVFAQTTEVDPSKLAFHDQTNKNAAIPGTVGIHDHSAEVEHSKPVHQDQTDKNAAIPGTVGVFAQTSEVGISKNENNSSNDLGVLRLRGENLPRSLTQAQCQSYHKEGYLILPDAITSSEADNLLSTAHSIMKRVSEGGEGIIRHEITGNGANTPSPVGRIIATFEPDDKTASSPFHRRISRLGCGMHKVGGFSTLVHSPRVRHILRSLGYSDPRITQSQVIAKLAGIGGEIVPHQDGCVSFSDPPSAITFWYALEDANVENGCLCVAPESHMTEPLRQRLAKDKGNGQPKFEDLAVPVWAKGAEAVGEGRGMEREYEYRALEVKKGTLVVFHGNLLHKSGINMSAKNRIAYNFNVIEGEGDCGEDAYLKPADGVYERL